MYTMFGLSFCMVFIFVLFVDHEFLTIIGEWISQQAIAQLIGEQSTHNFNILNYSRRRESLTIY